MNNFNQRLTQLINDFVDQVSALARQSAMETLAAALGGKTPRTTAADGKTTARRPRDGKRSASELDRMRNTVYDHIVANPGQRVEEMNRVLGTTTRDLALPLKKLLEDKQVRVEGQKRATKYFASGKKRG